MRDKALRIAAQFLEEKLNADLSDRPGPELPCSCGGTARYVDRREKTFSAVLGDITLKRAYYYCPACGKGFCPKDQALGLDGSSLSPGVIRMAGLVAASTSFQESALLLKELAGVPLDAKGVERAAKGLGTAIAQDEASFVEPALPASSTM